MIIIIIIIVARVDKKKKKTETLRDLRLKRIVQYPETLEIVKCIYITIGSQ